MMKPLLLTTILLFGCAGDQYLKGRNTASPPKEAPKQIVQEPVKLSPVEIGLWLGAFGVLGYSAWKWMTTESTDKTSV